MSLQIRSATEADVPLLLNFINKLAVYEKLAHEVVATEALLRENLFHKKNSTEVILGFWNNEPVGFALFFQNFSTFLGLPGIYLEDLFVDEAMRGRGFGKAMLAHLANLVVTRGWGRLDWAVLDWNTPSIEFYKSLGARPLEDWTTFRLTGDALKKLAGSST